MEKGKFCKNKDKGKSYLKWTKDMDRVLTSILVEQHNLGNQVPNGWKSVAYTAAINGIKEKCNVVITKDNIVSRLKTWDKHCAIITNMLGTSSFGWDWDRNMVKVHSDQVWEDYVKSHPEASSYRYKHIENWEDLATICGQDRATGDGAETGAEAMKEIEQEENTNNVNSNIIEETIYDTPKSTPTLAKQPTSILNPNLQRKRNRSGETLAIVVTHMANTISKAYSHDPIKASAEEIFAELSKVSDLEESELFRPCDVLTGDARKYESFKALPTILRKSWILMQIKN